VTGVQGGSTTWASPPRRILVVDDDDKLAGLLVRALERAGYACAVASSGDQALWGMAAQRPDALVLDVMIPHPSGVEVCRHLRSAGFDGPIVMISARSNPDDRTTAMAAGADVFLAKPFPLADLVGCLTALAARMTSEEDA
jgi:two-component system response regulator MprA